MARLPGDPLLALRWQRSLESVSNRIVRLGPINLAAIDEYSLQSERKNYLDAQNDDLEAALDTLQSAIRRSLSGNSARVCRPMSRAAGE